MSKHTHIMIHCADTPAGVWFDHRDIEKWHLKERGWSRVGYSVLFTIDGNTEILIPFDADDTIEPWELSNGAKGWNGTTRHYCYIGGKGGIDTRTAAQKAAMIAAIKFELMLNPDLKVIGHNQVNAGKYCPSFDVPQWALSIGIPEKNIDFKTYH